MAKMRAANRLTTAEPPPSPIPTAKGSRSAANKSFNQFLENSLHIPELIALPHSRHSSGVTRHLTPADVDFRSLSAESAALLLTSAKQLGAFRIIGHGIPAEELRSVVRKAESIFDQPRRFIERIGNRQEIAWVRDRNSESDEQYRDFCKDMEKVATRIEGIAEQVSEIFYGNAHKQFERQSEDKNRVFRLYRYSHEHDNSMEPNTSNEQNEITNANCDFDCYDHSLCLHLPLEHSQFYIQSDQGPLLFDAGPETIVVTVGHQLEGYKCVSGEMIFVPDISRSQASYSLQLKVPFSSNFTKESKTFSIADQILVAVFICVVYKVVAYIYTYITTR